MAYARGKYAKSISDRSGQEFPYREMVKEWNGSLVHISEFEAKHPQLDPPYHKADAIALKNTRSMKFQQPSQKFNPQLVQQMKLLYEDELARALAEDGSPSSTIITPKTYYPGA